MRALFLLFILGAAHKAWTGNRKTMSSDEDLGVIGASLVACIIAMLVIFENGSFGGAPEKAFYILAGLATGYGVLARSSRRDPHATRVGINDGHVGDPGERRGEQEGGRGLAHATFG